MPKASTSFTPIELLIGCQPRVLLDVAREGWEQQPAVLRSTIEHIREIRERIDCVSPATPQPSPTAPLQQDSQTTEVPARR